MIERAVALLFFVVAAAYLKTATGLSFGSLSAPRAGFLPWLVGVSALVLTGINLVRSIRGPLEPRENEINGGKVVLTVAGLAGYVALMWLVGFVIATLAATLYLLKIAGTTGWILPGAIAGATAGGIFAIFEWLLMVPLP